MFFTRETAHPRRLRFFPGLNGRPVQMVDDTDQLLDLNALNAVWKLPESQNRQSNLPMYAINWTNLSRMNKDTLNTLQYFTGLRNFSFRDQQMPKQLNGLAPVVDAWKQELTSFAQNVFQPDQEKTTKPATAVRPATSGTAERDVDTARQQLYSRKTGRLIESRAGRRPASQRTVRYPPLSRALSTDDLPALANPGDQHEYVIMQMLGQILQTDDPQAIGGWLASASDREKALAVELIRSVVASRSEYFKHDANPQGSSELVVKPPSAPPKSAAVQNRLDLQTAPEKPSLELFTIAEESAREPAPKADILNIDQERALLAGAGAKLYGYEGETTAPAPAPPVHVPAPPRKVSALPSKSRANTPGSVARSCGTSQHSCPNCGHSAVDSWRPATSYVNANASADAPLPPQPATAN